MQSVQNERSGDGIQEKLTSRPMDHALEDRQHPLAGHAQLPGTNMGTWPMPNTGPIVSTHRSDQCPYRLPCITLGTTMQGKHFPNCTFLDCEGLPTAVPTLDALYPHQMHSIARFVPEYCVPQQRQDVALCVLMQLILFSIRRQWTSNLLQKSADENPLSRFFACSLLQRDHQQEAREEPLHPAM